MRAVIVDEWVVLRHGLRVVLAENGIRTAAHCETAAEGFARAGESNVDLVVAGRAPDMTPDKIIRRALRLNLLPVVLVTGPSDPVLLMSLGARAVLPRAASERELVDAAARLKRGDRYLAPSLLASVGEEPRVRDSEGELTARERGVLAQLIRGATNHEIGAALYIGDETVKTHLRNIYTKLEVSDRRQAVGRAVELGLVF